MRRTHRLLARSVRWTSLCICFALVLSSFVVASLADFGNDSTAAVNYLYSPLPEGNGYTYSRSITIDHSKVPNSDQSNFPILISGTYSYLATVANGGNVQSPNGYDVIFTSDSSCATKLNHEVESYNAVTGAVNYWVKVPALSHTNDTPIYMCYGNASISTSQENKNGVWDSSFLNVLHFANPTTFNGADSTGDSNIATLESPASAATGKMGGALYSSTGDVNRAHGYNHGSNNVTLSAWVKTTDKLDIIDEFGANNDLLYLMVGDPFGLSTSFAHKSVIFYGETNDFNLPAAVGSTNVDDGNWHHIVGIRDETNKQLRIYVDGVLEGTTTYTGLSTSNPSGVNSRIGLGLGYGLGYVDEFRESHTSRSADWIKTEYNNQSSPSTFYTISSSGAYTYRRSITIDHAKVPNSDQSNFPLLISGTYSYLATVANGGRAQNSNGYDIIFTSDSGCATKLNHEVETYNATTGAVNYWVKVPTVSHTTTDTVIYMCYGNASITASEENKNGVWDANFKIVAHLGNGTTLSANDSTSNAIHGTITGATAVSGGIDGGASFNGSSNTISFPDLSSVGDFTISALVNPTSPGDPTGAFGWDNYPTSPRDATLFWVRNTPDGGSSVSVGKVIVGATGGIAQVGSAISNGNWHWIASIRSGTTAKLYVDGVKTGADITVGSGTFTAKNLRLASHFYNSANHEFLNGMLDEFRVSLIARSADWIKTEYNNQSAPSTFYTISTASGNQPPVANAGGSYSGMSLSALSFNGNSSSDPDGTITGYSWSFGDPNSGSNNSSSVATPTHTYATAGTYNVTLTVTDNAGATNRTSTTATISNRPPVANAGGPYTGITGTGVQLSGSGSDPDGNIANYTWSFGDPNSGSNNNDIDATPMHTYAPAGAYTVTLTVTDNSGATNSASTTATISNRPPVANAGGPYTGITGTGVQLSGSGSDPDGNIANYTWSFGDPNSGSNNNSSVATPMHTYAAAGTYTVTLTVTDNSGATNSASTTATISNRPPVANAGGPYTGITGTGVQLSGSGSDPDGNIANYTWSFGDPNSGSNNNDIDATPMHTYAPAGAYTVTLTVTDNSGATNSASTTATISNRPPVANAGGPYTGITGTGVQLSGSGSDPDGNIANYTWSFGDPNSGSNNNDIDATPMHTYAPAGAYTVTLTVTDNSGATNSASTTATISNRPPVANAGGPYTGITGTGVQLSGSGSDPDGNIANYTWSFGDPNSGSNNNSSVATPMHTYAAAGTYTVTLTVTDNSGATNSASTTATISNRPPVANAGGPYTGITGTGVQLSGSGSDPDGNIANYTWSFGDPNSGSNNNDIDATPMHTYAPAGAYTVTLTVTDNSGATNSASTTATISNRPPVANAGGPYTGITGTGVQLSGSGSDPDGNIANYTWSFGDPNSGSNNNSSVATPMHTYAAAGTYTVTLTVTDNSGATNSASTTATISNRPPVANAGGPYTGITGTGVQLSGSGSDPDGNIANYTWSFGDPNSGSNNNSSVATPMHTYAAAGTYTVTLTVTDNSGATNSASTTATISNRPPVANAGGPYTGITGTGVQLSGSGSDPDGNIANYTWSFGDPNSGSNNNSSVATPMHTYAAAGTYTVTLTVTDNSGATNSASTTATISNRPPVANAGGPYTGITGTGVQLSGSGSDPDGNIANYTWSFGDPNSGSNNNSSVATPMHTYAAAGTYTVTLTVTDNSGATNSASTTATISNRPPVANAGGPYTGITGTGVQLSGSGSDPDGNIANYTWSFGDPNSGSNNNSSVATPMHTYAAAGTYTVTLTVTDNSGATNSASTTATISNRPPVANAGGPYTGVTGTGVQFSGSGSDPDGHVVSYSWAFGDGNSDSGATTTHTYTGPGTYSATLTVTDDLGAQASASSSVTIASTADYYTQNFIQYALARPPSSDEVNYWQNIFRAAYAHGQDSMVLALREMGKTVFESSDYAARSRSDRDYVRDLYKTFLLREPDQQGWDNWTASVHLYGRDQVRRGFDESTEFLNLVATLTTSGAPSSAVSSLASARVDPSNQPGSGLLGRDAEWSTPLLSLPGRAGLDLGLSLSYSSMVWTRSGPYVYFDEDNGFPSPGFRLGFPTIQEKFFDAQTGVNVYLLVAAGSRVELGQVGSSNVYEAADSSYLQLIETGNLLVRSTDGTQLSFGWFDNEYRCIEIKDRNGNY